MILNEIMLKTITITVLLLGDSQTAGMMGTLLEQHYRNHGLRVHREAASGKGVQYFLSASRQVDRRTSINDYPQKILMFHAQRTRIRNRLRKGVDYIIVGSLGGNDAYPGCCTNSKQRKKMINRYKRLYKQLCFYGAIVIFNGSPPADISKWSRFDRRRAQLDKIQDEAAVGTCIIRNSVRGMRIPPDVDGYHYNRSARLYVEYLIRLPGMDLPLLEAYNAGR
jgi:hypothetical protein